MKRESSLIIKQLLFCAASLSLLHNCAIGQWRQVGKIPEQLTSIHVVSSDAKSILVGSTESVWITFDAGASWRKTLATGYRATQFAFKDDHLGWVGISPFGASVNGGCYKTSDGGLTWSRTYTGSPSAVWYNPLLRRILVASWVSNAHAYSDDEGQTWTPLSFGSSTAPLFLGGFAFMDPYNGLVTGVGTDSTYLTSDGGMTWRSVKEPTLETWQATAMRKRGIYFRNSEPEGQLIMSTNGGENWSEVYTFQRSNPGQAGVTTGDIHVDSCGSLYVQTITNGIFRSADLGLTWETIGGPSLQVDTRFYLEDKGLFAVDTFDLEDGRSSVWQFVGPPLRLSIPERVILNACNDSALSINFAFDDFCVGAYPILLAKNISGSKAFEIDTHSLAYEIRSSQTLGVRYRTGSSTPDTTYLTLTFWTGNVTFDTTITFISQEPSHQDVSLKLVTDKTVVENNEDVNVKVVPDNVVQSAGLNKMSFNLEYRDDLFRLLEATSPVGALIGNGQHIGSRMVIPVALNGKDVSLDPNQPIVQLRLASRLSDSVRTEISLSDLMLNDGDIEYQNCKLSASSTSTSVEVALNCGDPTIQRVIRGERALAIKSITPNPTNGKLTIDYESKFSGEVMLSVYSVNGVVMHEEVVHSAGKPIQLNTSGWPSGAYTIVLRSGDDEARGTVIKE